MRIPKVGMIGMAVLGAAGMAGAHLTSGSLSVKGGETFAPGQNVTLTWTIATSHGSPVNIDVTLDGGTTWKSLKAGLSDAAGPATSKVDMPAEASTHAKIRVCQGAASACASIKASQPGTAPYTLVSNEFTISGSSAILPAPAPAYALGFEPASGKFVASFDLARAEKVSLQVVDFKGRVQAALLDGTFAAGAHKMSLALPPELSSASALIFRMQIGETVRTQALTRP
jgi:hypothetical protein